MAALRVGMAQINTTVGDLDGNASRILEHVHRAASLGCDLVAFPELAITGYPPEDLVLRSDFVHDNVAVLQALARKIAGVAAVVGFVDADRGHIYNAAALIAGGRVGGIYHKQRLPNYGVFDEMRTFAPGSECPVFVVGGSPVGLTVCEDIWEPGGSPQLTAERGALVLVNINASPYHREKWRERQAILQARARAYSAVIAYVNQVGGQDELVFDGMSVLVDIDGTVLARGRAFEEDLVVADVNLDAARRARGGRPAPPVEPVVVSGPAGGARPQVEPHVVEPPHALDEVYQALLLGTRDYVHKNRFRDVVMALSGGIDSSLVATIAADALGPGRVTCVFMPSRYTRPESREYARAVASALGVRYLEIPIDGSFTAYLDALRDVFAGTEPNVAEENVQARIRGNIVMAVSNKFGSLVLTTGNKSEMAVGYATLYGDMAGGFAVLKDVPKTLVYELARHRNAVSPVIPEGVLRRPPSPELRPNHLTTDTLPPYDVLDPIVHLYVEEDASPPAIVSRGFPAEVVARVVAMIDRNEYKRRQAPPGIKITPKAFGRDRRLPITNWYRGAAVQAGAPAKP